MVINFFCTDLILIFSLTAKCRNKLVKLSKSSDWFIQIDDAGFSLNHPNQYFMESQKLLGGGKEVKKEVEVSQKGQESTSSNGPSVPSSQQKSSTQAVDDLGDLDSYFLDE